MGEPIIMTISPEQIAQATQSAAFGNALALLTQEVWAILALLAVGMAIGMATVAIVRMYLPNVDGDGPKAWEARHLLLTRIGAAASGLWTGCIEWVYLSDLLGTVWALAALTAVGAGILAAACNKPAFKPVKAIWKWALGKLRRRIESDGGTASDLDDTDYKRKP